MAQFRITIPDDSLADVDILCGVTRASRSQIIETLIRFYLAELKDSMIAELEGLEFEDEEEFEFEDEGEE